VIACQSENNIPTVGRRYVIDGREMHWLRIDRYWVGTPEDPDTVHQPLPCMHCENAPCETVCPVIATVHSDEGTNDMIYNRCVGTRYCSNNCPYKVRRFNWFSYTDIVEPRQMALNPEVTVRFRGVMEKCTFCLHRIRSTKSHAKIEGRPLKTDEFTTACAQSCPTKAIVFGDLNDANAQVAKMFNQPKSYSLLEELNTKPRVRYQVKVRNTDALKGFDSHHEEGHHA
jgi:molybdopterin-containing oxidoreductase family iron-sulfur binding subunit